MILRKSGIETKMCEISKKDVSLHGFAPIVEWIEFQMPVLTVAVRFRMGVPDSGPTDLMDPDSKKMFQCSIMNIGTFFRKILASNRVIIPLKCLNLYDFASFRVRARKIKQVKS